MKADVTTVIHLTDLVGETEQYKTIIEAIGLVYMHSSSIEELHWLTERVNKYIILISDPKFSNSEIYVESPIIRLELETLVALKQKLKA